MAHKLINTDAQLLEACRRWADAPAIAFDTEFISEHTYRPELCLVQVAVGEELGLIDALAVGDMLPFWETLAAPGHETIVHAGRQELMFSLEAIGRAPANLFDIQVAGGMIGLEYPAGYGNLVFKMLGVRAHKGETRTDWSRRPLSDKQLEYALDDVRHLEGIKSQMESRLERLKRREWFRDEMGAWQVDIENARTGERWRRVSGSPGLPPQGLAIIRELWQWREEEAQRRDRPARLVLRDDLIVELAKRRSSDPKQIAAVRGMERGDFKRMLPELAAAVERAMNLAESDWPPTIRSESNSHLTMLGQFLSSALSSICQDAEIAASLVGTANDVRDLIAYHLAPEHRRGEKPLLATGWRADIVGHLLDDLLAGRASIRIRNPRAEQPLVFEPYEKAESGKRKAE